VEVEPGSQLAGICGPGALEVNTSHHQAVARLGDGLIVTARAPDGTVEAIEDPDKPLWLGVQWHPERLADDPRHASLFKRLVEEAAGRSDMKRRHATPPAGRHSPAIRAASSSR
jgi:putative glutamine amidotransferase